MPAPDAALRSQLHYLERASPFWRERLGGRAGAVRTPADLPGLPLTTKTDLRADQAAHPPFGARLCVFVEAGDGAPPAGAVADELRGRLRTRVAVTVLPPGALPVAEQKTRTVYRTARGDELPPAIARPPKEAM